MSLVINQLDQALKVALAQINPTVGDLQGNTEKIIRYAQDAKHAGAQLVVFPELALTGYPPEDLLLKKHFILDNIKALERIVHTVKGINLIIGFVDIDPKGNVFNAAAFISEGKIVDVYYKKELPNYGVFDEKRYFKQGVKPGLVRCNGILIGLSICEDIWVDGAVYKTQAQAGAELLINISSSPYCAGKLKVRQELLMRRAKELKIPVVYVNAVGGQDELVFDGGSMVVSAEGKIIGQSLQFKEDLLSINFKQSKQGLNAVVTRIEGMMEEESEIYDALVLGTRDYALKNGFKKVALGLSGGIDSALVACIACDAFGSSNVTAVSMPSVFNSKSTREDARILAKNLKLDFKEIPIKKIMGAYLKTMAPLFANKAWDTTEENIQARIRGNILMAIANKFGGLILTTGNKSEMAVGYCTLYGDMSGGYAVLKDVFKTKVYALARYRNSLQVKAVIPKSTIMRAPSAELRLNQTDKESLGAYEDLDRVLMAYIEEHASLQDMVDAGMEATFVTRTIRLVDTNEYKRRQSPPGVKITPCAFGKDWRLPITNRYKQ